METKRPVANALRVLLLTGVAMVLAGCIMQGRLFTNVTEPLSWDFDNTPLGTKTCVVKNYRLKEPVSRFNVSAEWTRGEIVEAAQQAGISRVYYVDMHTFSVLLGVYRRKEIIVYGD